MSSRPSRVAEALAALAGLLVLLRVVLSSVRTLAGGAVDGVVTGATVVLLVAALGFVAATAWFVSSEGDGPRGLFARALVGFLVVMAGYLALGLLLALHVPWTAYPVLLAVAALGGVALVLDARASAGRR